MRRDFIFVGFFVACLVGISGCGAEASSKTPRRAGIRATLVEVEYENNYLIEVTYQGRAHLYIQPKFGDIKPLTEVGSREQ